MVILGSVPGTFQVIAGGSQSDKQMLHIKLTSAQLGMRE